MLHSSMACYTVLLVTAFAIASGVEVGEKQSAGIFFELVEAKKNPPGGTRLPPGQMTTVCPDSSSFPTGLSFICKNVPSGTESVTFFVDGAEERTERVSPYAIGGDLGGNVYPWDVSSFLGKKISISCKTNLGISETTTIYFSCRSHSTVAPRTESSCASQDSTCNLTPVHPETAVPTTAVPATTLVKSVSSTADTPRTKRTAATTDENRPVLALIGTGSLAVPDISLSPDSPNTICPKAYRNRFTFICHDLPSKAASVTFSIDGVAQRTESVAPYVLSGDDVSSGKIYSWDFLPYLHTSFTLACETSDGDYTSSLVTLSCDSQIPVTNPTATSASTVVFFSTTAATTLPTTTNQPTTEERSTTPKTDEKGCVLINPLMPDQGSLSKSFVARDNGVEYKPEGHIEDIEAAGVSVMSYTFTVPKSGEYAITMDATTRHRTEFNDIWIRVAGLGTRYGLGGDLDKGWVKFFSNRNGRALFGLASTRDHKFSTPMPGRPLEAGEAVTIEVSGRSAQFILHHLVLFSCNLESCNIQKSDGQSRAIDCFRA